MTTLTSVVDRIDNALTALEPLATGARLNEDAAFQRRQTGIVQAELAEARRIVQSMTNRMAAAAREVTFAAMPSSGQIRVDGGLGDPRGAVDEDAQIVLTFDAAARVKPFAWPVAEPADSEGGEC